MAAWHAVTLDTLALAVVICRSRAALQKAVAHTAHSIHSRTGQGAATAAASACAGNTDDIFALRDGSSHGRTSSRWQQQQQQQQQQAAAASNKRCTSLFGFLNYTSTSCGARLLRCNLLQPLTDINTLQLRLDSLQVCFAVCELGYACIYGQGRTVWAAAAKQRWHVLIGCSGGLLAFSTQRHGGLCPT
jgi:hypothetical protein